MRRKALAGRLIGALVVTLLLCGFTDHVSVETSAGHSAWLLIDGPEHEPDDLAMEADPSMEVGSLGAGKGEIILFPSQADGAVRMIPVDWTDGEDAMGIAPAPRIDLPVTVWILHAPEGESAARIDVLNSILMANAIFECEHMGIRIVDTRINYTPLEYGTRQDILDFTCNAIEETRNVYRHRRGITQSPAPSNLAEKHIFSTFQDNSIELFRMFYT